MDKGVHRKIVTYRRLLEKPYWHLFEVAEYVSGITSLDMFAPLPSLLAGAFILERIPIGSYAFNEGEEKENVCLVNYNHVLRVIYKSIQSDQIEFYPIMTPFYGRSTKIEEEFPHLLTHSYLVRPLEVLYLLVTEGIILPHELQVVLRISQISHPLAIRKGSMNSLKRDAVSQVVRFENPKDNLTTHRERLKKLKELLEVDQSINKLSFRQEAQSRRYDPLWKREFNNLSLALHFLHTHTGNRSSIAFSNTKPAFEGALPQIPSIMQQYKGAEIAFDFNRMKTALDIVSSLLLLKYPNMTSESLLNHELISMYGSIGGASVMEITKFCLKDTVRFL